MYVSCVCMLVMYVCMLVRLVMYVCMYVRTYVCMYVYIALCIYANIIHNIHEEPVRIETDSGSITYPLSQLIGQYSRVSHTVIQIY